MFGRKKRLRRAEEARIQAEREEQARINLEAFSRLGREGNR